MTDEIDTPHPLAGLPFDRGRSLYLEDWATLVTPDMEAGRTYVAHSVSHATSALQASYVIHGGALGILPVLLGSLTGVPRAAIALAAIPFVFGIISTAIASVCS